MATTKKPETPAEETPKQVNPWNERREVYIPRVNGMTSKLVVVNGRSFNVPCGRMVAVPLPVAEVIEHSIEAMEHAEKVRDQLRKSQQQ